MEYQATQVSVASVAIVVSPGYQDLVASPELAGFQDLVASPVILDSLVSQDIVDLAALAVIAASLVFPGSLDLVV